jgi:hypothetical protein
MEEFLGYYGILGFSLPKILIKLFSMLDPDQNPK